MKRLQGCSLFFYLKGGTFMTQSWTMNVFTMGAVILILYPSFLHLFREYKRKKSVKEGNEEMKYA